MSKLIIGLGNPGDQYKITRHNAGFLVLDYVADKLNVDFKLETKFKGFVGVLNKGGEKVYFLKPTTYMNLSGESIKALMTFFKINIEDIIVIYDDLDTAKGQYKIKQKGSSGGHNGIKSMIQHLGTETFNRIKVGIKKENKDFQTVDYVLGRFTEEELALLNIVREKAFHIIQDFINGYNIIEIMNRHN